MELKRTLKTLSLAAALSLTVVGCGGGGSSTPAEGSTPVEEGITTAQKTTALTAYADLAIAGYTAALTDAQAMVTALKSFTDTPSAGTLEAAKTAWKTARESYGVTEIFRLSNGPIDAEDGFAATFGAPEGQLNAWPLDENMIDYTTDGTGTTTAGNIIDTAGSFTPTGGTAVDATTITKEVLSQLNENGGDANVATGYHAVEFLLWGQDQDYASFVADNITHGPTTAGERALEDYDGSGTNEHANADRRKAYLNAAAELIVDDLQSMVDAWTTGGYKTALIGEGTNAIAQDTALKQIMAGMGVFIKSELANERIAVALLTPSEEDEHSCFSDNTHRDIALNYEGFKNALDVFKTNLSDAQKTAIETLYASIDAKVTIINDTAATKHFDYQIQPNDPSGANIKAAKDEMRDLGDEMIDVADEYGVTLGEDDVTDPDESDV